MQKARAGVVYCFTLLAVCWLLAACGQSDAQQTLTGSTMGTTYTVKVRPVPASIELDELHTNIERILAEVNSTMSTYDPDSELSQLNQNPSTDWLEISEGLLVVLQAALAASELSDGVFDVTVGPLVNVWGFGPDMTEDDIPLDAAIADAMARAGYRRIQLRDTPPALKKERSDIYIDLSAIAKGYAVDRVAHYLDALGIANYLVEIGGELRGRGQNPEDRPWSIAIEKPVPGERAVERVIHITDQGMATSGNYRNFFEKDGRRYAHIIDPRTGKPIAHELASVTVVSNTCMHADAMATALLALGPEAGFALAEQQRLAVFFITIETDGFREKYTSAFEPYLVH